MGKFAKEWHTFCLVLVSQEVSHVGHAGVGIVSLTGVPVALPSFATPFYQKFFDLGRLVRSAFTW